MSVLNFLNQIFIIVFPLALITTEIWNKMEIKGQKREKDNKSGAESSHKKTEKWENGIYIILLLSFIFLILIAFVLLLKSLNKYRWIIILLSVPMCIQYLTGACIAIGTLSNVVRTNEPGRLSNRELTAIQIIAYVIFFLNAVNPYVRLLEYAKKFSSSVVLDTLTALILVFFAFVYTFLIIALISTPLVCVINLLKIVRNHFPFREQIERVGDYFVKHIDIKIENEAYLIRTIKYIQRFRFCVKFLLYFLIPVVYLFDIINMCVLILLSILQSTIGYIVILFRIAKNVMKVILLWFLKLSDKRIVALSFRLALIFALVSIVVLNRYQPVFKEYEESTAVFEFLASSIIIPVVFEWIYSLRNVRDTQEE